MKRVTHIIRRTLSLAVVSAMLIASPAAIAENYSGYANAKVTIYSDMSMKKSVGTLSKYTVVTVLNVTDSIAAINYNGTMCYVSADAVSRVSTTAMAATVNANTTVYMKPDTSSTSTALKKGWSVYVIAVQDDWALIERNGYSGFCYAKYLTKVADAEESYTAYVSASSVNVYAKASTSSSKLGSLSKGTQINVLKVSNGWAYIERNGNYGYCVSSALANTADPEPTAVSSVSIAAKTTKATVMYKKASTGSTKMITLQTGARVTLHSVSGSWAYIDLNGTYGYCDASALTTASGADDDDILSGAVSGTLTAKLKVYKSASTSSTKLGTLPKGTTVNVISVSNGWAYIELGGNYGYCASKSITLHGTLTPNATPDPSSAVSYTVTSGSTIVYASASTSGTKLGTLSKGTEVSVLSIDGNWAYISRNGSYGYCQTSALTRTSDLSSSTKDPNSGYTTETFSATVISTDAKFYQKASTSASGKSVSIGTNVTVSAYNSQWAYVTYSGTQGYMLISALSRTSYTALSAGSSGTNVTNLEKALLTLGYFDGVPGTSYSAYTQNAVKLFQAQCGISVTGNADLATLRVLYGGHAPKSTIFAGTYKSGSSGTNVSRIQLRLNSLKYLSKTSSVDGDYGSITTAAIKLFQKANSLTVSGNADSATIAKLYSTSAVSLPSGQTAADGSSSGGSDDSGSTKISGGDQKANTATISKTLASTQSTFSSSLSNAKKLEYVIYIAQKQLGKTYVFGATGTATFDCSGFTQYCFKQAGISLLRTAYQQGYNNNYTKISSVSSLKRGDLVFFNTVSDSDSCDHVGIYLGAGWFMHASSGYHKVVVSNITSGYYNRVFSWGRRILN